MKTKTKFVFNEKEAEVIWKVFGNIDMHIIYKAVDDCAVKEVISDRIFEQLDEVFSKK